MSLTSLLLISGLTNAVLVFWLKLKFKEVAEVEVQLSAERKGYKKLQKTYQELRRFTDEIIEKIPVDNASLNSAVDRLRALTSGERD